jgi:signal transduction histidine kinase
VDRLSNASRQMGTLVEGLLEYTRLDSGRLQLQPRELDLAQLARDTLDELRPQVASQSPGLQLVAPEAPAVAHTDPRLLKVVLSNLLANALKFTHEGRIAVRVQADDRQALLEVEDSGSGIAPEDLERIFLPFEALEPLHRKSVPGVGLGLSLVQRIVRALGGEIHVRSTPGVGSVFSVRLPARVPEAAEEEIA